MIYPSLSKLMENVDSRYTLVVATAKRARQLVDNSQKLVNTKSNKPVTVATHEIAEGMITYQRTKFGIK